MIISLTFVLILSQMVFGQFVSANDNVGNLKALCEGKYVRIHVMDDLRRLVSNKKEPGHGCDERVIRAIDDLVKIAMDTNACTMSKATAITNYVDKYLKDTKEEAGQEESKREVDGDSANKNQAVKLPKPLAEFAIAYGMRVSGVCSRHVMEQFAGEAERRFNRILKLKDNKALKQLFIEDSPVSTIMSALVKPGEIILPTDLMQAAPGMEKNVGIYLSDRGAMSELKRLCENILQPLYEKTLLPLAHLIRAGFNNREFYWRRIFHENGTFWSSSVFMCETVKLIKLDGKRGSESINEDEAALGAELKSAIRGVSWTSIGQKMDADELHVPFGRVDTYYPDQKVGDDIYTNSMRSLIKSFDANKSAVERMQERLKKRGLKLFTKLLRKNAFKPLLMKILRSFNPTGESSRELEETKNAMIAMLEAPKENSMAYNAYRGITSTLYWIKLVTDVVLMAIPYTIMVLIAGDDARAFGRWADSWVGIRPLPIF